MTDKAPPVKVAKKRKPQKERDVRPTEGHRKIAKKYIREGKPMAQAMRESGYSRVQGRKGLQRNLDEKKGLRIAFAQELDQVAKEAAECKRSPDELGNIVELVLIRNALHGERKKSGSNFAAKTLGQLSRVKSFDQPLHIGILNLQVPEQWKERYSLPAPEKEGGQIADSGPEVIEAEVVEVTD